MELSPQQEQAITLALNPHSKNQVITISGAAGTGKSTLLKALTVQMDRAGYSWSIFTPTHKAAGVLRGKGIDPAQIGTIKAGFYRPRFTANYEMLKILADDGELTPWQWVKLSEQFPPDMLQNLKGVGMSTLLHDLGIDPFHPLLFSGWDCRDPEDERLDVIVIDEASMVLASEVEQAKQFADRVILLGDDHQLPPVDSDKPAFESYRPDITLTEVHRQSGDSGILALARDVLNPELSLYSLLNGVDAGRYSGVMGAELPDYSAIHESPILCWRNRTRIRANVAYRDHHGHKPRELRSGDPIIGSDAFDKTRNRRFRWQEGNQLIPDDGGDAIQLAGTLICCESKQAWREAGLPEGEHVYAIEPGGKNVCFFSFGAAITTHKSQGGEYSRVQIHLPDLLALSASATGKATNSAGVAYWRRHLYTSVTRAKDSVSLVLGL